MLRRKPTYSSKHLNGPPNQLLSTTNRATLILAFKALGIGSSSNISSGDTWNAFGTIPENPPKLDSGTIPEPFRKIYQNLVPDTLRNTYGYSWQCEANFWTATRLLLILPIQKTAMLNKFRPLIKF